MRKFILDFTVIAILILLFNLICYQYIFYPVLYEKYEKPKKDLKDSYLFKDFILADSHGWALTNKKKFISERFASDSVYNFSYGSDSYGDILVKLHWLLQNKIQIDHIVLTIDDHMLTKNSNNRNRTIVFSNAKLHKEIYHISHFRYYYYYLSKFFPIIYSSNQKIIVEFIKHRFSNSKKSFEVSWLDKSQKDKNSEVLNRLNTFFPNNKIISNSLLVSNLEHIVKLCNDNEISIIALKFPLDPIMIRKMESNNYIGSVEAIFKNLGNTSKIVNFQTRFNESSMMSNADHINAIGADSLSTKIIKIIKNE